MCKKVLAFYEFPLFFVTGHEWTEVIESQHVVKLVMECLGK